MARARPAGFRERSVPIMERSPRSSWDGLIFAVGLALASAVAILVVATRTGRSYLPVGDVASIELRVRDVFTRDTPLVGAYSRGFNHPGPLVFWVLAPLSRLTGGAAWATLVGGALLQLGAIVLSGVVAFRRGGVWLATLILTGVGLAYGAVSLGNPLLEPWNPNVAFPFLVLFVLQAWSFVLGHRWHLVWGAITATFLVQAHVGYLPVVAAIVGWAAIRWVLARRSGRPTGPSSQQPWRPVVGTAAAVVGVLWLAPVLQQLTDDPGNLSAIVEQFTDGADDKVGLWRAAGLYAAEFAWLPPWMGGHDTLQYATSVVQSASVLWLLVPATLLLVGFAAARHSRRVPDRLLLEVVTVLAGATILTISRIDVDPVPFLFYWRIWAAVLVVVAALHAVGHVVTVGARTRTAVLVGLLAVFAVAVWPQARDVVDRRDAVSPIEPLARALVDDIERELRPTGPVLVRGIGASTDGVAQAAMAELDRTGLPVRVDPEFGFQYGDHRTATRADVAHVLYISQDGRFRSLFDGSDGGRVVGYASPLSRAEDREVVRLQRSVAAQLERAGRPDLVELLDSRFVALLLERERVTTVSADAAQRLQDLNEAIARSDGCRCTAILYPAASAPDLPFTMGF